MRQKTIIQVWGRWGRGKSSTIKITREELISRYIDTTHTYNLPLANPNDISETITCNGFTVGIESNGDYLHYRYSNFPTLNERLDDFIINQQVDLLICASRVRNDVNTHIEHLASTNGYRVIKVAPYIDEYVHFNTDEVNSSAARQLVQLVDDIFIRRL